MRPPSILKEYHGCVIALIFGALSLTLLLVCAVIGVDRSAVTPNAFYAIIGAGVINLMCFCFLWVRYVDKLKYIDDG